jgi:hypothetical protein
LQKRAPEKRDGESAPSETAAAAVTANVPGRGTGAGRHRLRGCDSVHLAAAEAVYRAAGEPAGFLLAAFDASLARAATAEGLALLEP